MSIKWVYQTWLPPYCHIKYSDCSAVQLLLTLISTAECTVQNVNETLKLTLFKRRPKPGALGISS